MVWPFWVFLVHIVIAAAGLSQHIHLLKTKQTAYKLFTVCASSL